MSKFSFYVYSNWFVNFSDKKISLFFHYDSYWKGSKMNDAHLDLFSPLALDHDYFKDLVLFAFSYLQNLW